MFWRRYDSLDIWWRDAEDLSIEILTLKILSIFPINISTISAFPNMRGAIVWDHGVMFTIHASILYLFRVKSRTKHKLSFVFYKEVDSLFESLEVFGRVKLADTIILAIFELDDIA